MKRFLIEIAEWRQTYFLVLLVSLVTAIIYGILLAEKNISLAREETNRNRAEVIEFTTILSPVVHGFDLISVDSIGQALHARSYIRAAVITGPGNVSMFMSDMGEVNAIGPENLLVVTSDIIDYRNPNNPPGMLRAYIDAPSTLQVYTLALFEALVVFATIIVVGLIAATVYANWFIARPIKQLQEAVERTLDSGQPVETETSNGGFIGTFQHQFNVMQSRLLTARSETEFKSRDLAARTDLVQEVLKGVDQTVRLYGPTGHVDLGKKQADFQFPDQYVTTPEEFEVLFENMPDFEVAEILQVSVPMSTKETVLFALNVKIGDEAWYSVVSIALPGSHYALLVTDITETKLSEAFRDRAERMETIGSLTSGIAHDFNNVLAMIVGALDLIGTAAEDPESVRRYREDALNASRRAASVITSLLRFAQHKPELITSVSVKAIVEEVMAIVKAPIQSSVDLRADCPIDAMLTIDLAGLESALINLVVNARDAMRGCGKIEVSARFATETEISRRGLEPSETFVIISVTDDGPGIPPENFAKITEAFFSTKEGGSGLGLAMVSKFAADAGGCLYFENNSHRGATFSVILPATLDPTLAQEAQISVDGDQLVRVGKAKVLLIEDEDVLRKIIGKILTHYGYICKECSGLAEVRDHLLKKANLPDIVVTDLNLADGLGVEILNPEFSMIADVPKILMSGNIEGEEVEKIHGGFDEVLGKPVEGRMLSAMIDRCLAKRHELSQKP